MRKYGKWALVLGLTAATPGLSFAAPWSRADDGDKATNSAEPKTQSKTENQKTADAIAVALRDARLQGYDIEIECKNGVATLKGRVVDPKQKEKATAIASKVRGVEKVENQLVLAPKPSLTQRMGGSGGVQQAGNTSASPKSGAVQQAGHTASRPQPGAVQQASHTSSGPKGDRVTPVNFQGGVVPAAPVSGSNQAVAEDIGAALTAAGLDGYDITIQYQNGVVALNGVVPTAAQRAAAERIAQQVPGVQAVQNQLRTTQSQAGAMGPQGAMLGPGAMMGPQGPMMGPQGGVHPAAFQGGMPGGPMMPAGGVPTPYGHPGAGANPAVYNMPSMPEHAWPSYAQYPNSAAVNYPTQYSASAWPYIGPFYPYPQVPLGWRDATLRWDDGQWNLQFRQRTDKWWWFLSPKNW